MIKESLKILSELMFGGMVNLGWCFGLNQSQLGLPTGDMLQNIGHTQVNKQSYHIERIQMKSSAGLNAEVDNHLEELLP